MVSARLTAAVLALCLAVSPVRAGEEIGIAVMEFASKGGLTQEQMDALSDMLANEIRGRGGFRVIGKSDIRTTLQMLEDKTALGCSDDSCIAELGGALGVRWVVVGNVSLFGKTYLLNLKLLDVEAVKVAWSTSLKVSGGEDKLLDALSAAATDMLAKVFAVAPPEKPAPAPAPTPTPSGTSAAAEGLSATAVSSQAHAGHSAFSTWGHITFWSGVALGGFATAAAIVAARRADVFNTIGLSVDERMSAGDDARAWTGLMWIGLGGCVALMAAGTTLWLLDPGKSGSTVSAGATLLPGGAALALEGRW